MNEDFLKSCKRCVVQAVCNPGLFLMVEYHKDKSHRNEMREFENLLAKNVKFVDQRNKGFTVGQIVAVAKGKVFQRGVITDICIKNQKYTYEVVLIDYGNMVEVSDKEIALIKSKELQDKKFGVLEVKLHGIWPVTLDINHYSSGLFEKRLSLQWSDAAFKLVREEMQKHPTVYVKSINCKDKCISGDIYLLERPGAKLISLAEMLCEKGFGMMVNEQKKLPLSTLGGIEFKEIEMKIPETALCKAKHDLKSAKSESQAKRPTSLAIKATSDSQSLILRSSQSVKSSPLGSPQAIKDLELDSESVNYSPSWILKKFNGSVMSSSSSCDSPKEKSSPEDNQPLNSPEINLFRVIQRSLALSDEHKKYSKGHCHN